MVGHMNDDDVDPQEFANALGPGAVDHMLRRAMDICWMTMARDRRSVDGLAEEMRRLLERAIQDMRQDEDKRLGS